MQRLLIVGIPPKARLRWALGDYTPAGKVYFWVRPETGGPKRQLYGHVVGLSANWDIHDYWQVRFQPSEHSVSGGRLLVGTFSMVAGRGHFDVDLHDETNPPIEWLGFDDDIWELLIKAGISTLAELLSLDEFKVCQLLMDLPDSHPVQGQEARDRFERCRNRLNVLGHEFAGHRHTLYQLNMMF